MICTYTCGNCVFEFDAKNKVNELRRVRIIAKEHGWEFEDMVKTE